MDALDFAAQCPGHLLQPCAGDRCGGGLALLGFAVIAGFLSQCAFGCSHFRFACGLCFGKALSRTTPRFGERGGAGEQALAEDFYCKGTGTAALLGSTGDQRAYGGAEGVECLRKLGFGRVRLQFQSHGRSASTETRLIGLCCVDVAFQTADEHFSYPKPCPLGEFVGAGETHGVQQFEQASERARVTVVRCCRQEQLMLETWCYRSQHSAQLAVFAVRRRHQIVAFIDDQ